MFCVAYDFIGVLSGFDHVATSFLYFPAFPSPVGTDVNHIRPHLIVREMPQCVFGIAVHLLYMFGQGHIQF